MRKLISVVISTALLCASPGIGVYEVLAGSVALRAASVKASPAPAVPLLFQSAQIGTTAAPLMSNSFLQVGFGTALPSLTSPSLRQDTSAGSVSVAHPALSQDAGALSVSAINPLRLAAPNAATRSPAVRNAKETVVGITADTPTKKGRFREAGGNSAPLTGSLTLFARGIDKSAASHTQRQALDSLFEGRRPDRGGVVTIGTLKSFALRSTAGLKQAKSSKHGGAAISRTAPHPVSNPGESRSRTIFSRSLPAVFALLMVGAASPAMAGSLSASAASVYALGFMWTPGLWAGGVAGYFISSFAIDFGIEPFHYDEQSRMKALGFAGFLGTVLSTLLMGWPGLVGGVAATIAFFRTTKHQRLKKEKSLNQSLLAGLGAYVLSFLAAAAAVYLLLSIAAAMGAAVPVVSLGGLFPTDVAWLVSTALSLGGGAIGMLLGGGIVFSLIMGIFGDSRNIIVDILGFIALFYGAIYGAQLGFILGGKLAALLLLLF